ncbi:unnamed protein product [Cuscuta epithymum]|uniref:Uncharacterized protein n=1 Tax=Cuscuta epithymum TaxID=186058 RepID=A0AAV0ERR3_9ASTE|nr:unnamed protein product [Cuscuta epithymum]
MTTFLDAFSLRPVPFPVLSILAVLCTFLSLQWFVSYKEVAESAKEDFGWVLIALPLILLFAVRWLSSAENLVWLSDEALSWDRQGRVTIYNCFPSEGMSPWAVAALIVMILFLIQYRSSFLETWFY